MREIKFRGKDVKTGEWVYGAYVQKSNYIVTYLNKSELLESEIASVDPDTVGQYTGCKDTNGKDVFEGDIVTENLFWDMEKKEIVYFEIVFEENGFNLKDKKGMIFKIGQEPTIVGNIHDNPELLK